MSPVGRPSDDLTWRVYIICLKSEHLSQRTRDDMLSAECRFKAGRVL